MAIGLRNRNRGNGGGGAGIEKMTFRELKGPFVANIDNVQDSLDQMTFDIAADEGLFLYIPHFANNVDGVLSASKFLCKNNLAGSSFDPGNPVSKFDLIHILTLSVTDILADGNTQIEDLGDYDGNLSDYVNDHGPYAMQSSSIGERVFERTAFGIKEYFLFTRPAGVYGVGEEQTVDSDYIPFSAATPTPGLEQVLAINNRGIKAIDGSPYSPVFEDKYKVLFNTLADEKYCEIDIIPGTFKAGDTLYMATFTNGIDAIQKPSLLKFNSTGEVQFSVGARLILPEADSFTVPLGNLVKLRLLTEYDPISGNMEYWLVTFEPFGPTERFAEGFLRFYPEAITDMAPLKIGGQYQIVTHEGDDDFTDSGAPNNDVGTVFTATKEIPLNWAFASQLNYLGNPIVEDLRNNLGFSFSTSVIGSGDGGFSFKCMLNNFKGALLELPPTGYPWQLFGFGSGTDNNALAVLSKKMDSLSDELPDQTEKFWFKITIKE